MTELDKAYNERNQLVAALSKLYPSHLAIDRNADLGWQTVVCVHIKFGKIYKSIPGAPIWTEKSQAAWHIPDRELELFSHLHMQDNDWDGHSTEEKYQRLRAIRK